MEKGKSEGEKTPEKRFKYFLEQLNKRKKAPFTSKEIEALRNRFLMEFKEKDGKDETEK